MRGRAVLVDALACTAHPPNVEALVCEKSRSESAAAIRARIRFWRGGDEAQSRRAQKFFYCQTPRLRVRASGPQRAHASRDDLIEVSVDELLINRNSCNAGASCKIDHRR